jgi:hypothetical protein
MTDEIKAITLTTQSMSVPSMLQSQSKGQKRSTTYFPGKRKAKS